MEDTSVKKGYYAYMLRVDISLNDIDEQFTCYVDKYQPSYWLIGKETAPDTGKEHLQGIVWFENLEKNISNHRTWWKKRASKTTQPVAITSAKKIKNLMRYCKKDEDFITNLTELEINNIEKWIPKVDSATKHEQLQQMLAGVDTSKKQDYICAIVDKYYKIFGNLPRSGTVEKYLYEISSSQERKVIRKQKYSYLYQIASTMDYEEYEKYED